MSLREFVGKYRSYIAFVLGLAFAVLDIFGAYDGKRNITLDIGAPGDSPFLSGFYADEPDIDFRYRWTKTHAEVAFIGAGSAQPQYISVRAQGPRGDAVTQPITASFKLNGISLLLDLPSGERTSVFTLTGNMESYYLYLPKPNDSDLPFVLQPYTLTIDTSAYNPPGDDRTLGIKLDEVGLSQWLGGGQFTPS